MECSISDNVIGMNKHYKVSVLYYMNCKIKQRDMCIPLFY
ncbi:hypothetical protein J2W55_003415 [Mucilaginibacter pocheonensis]|uniref:Uncharacterized protein n=1 Tax=Mucilaginibacter pocheonensis TaxID=398050 RepID=A0ABU1TDX2_9SPHI|nr:hypothetical protein [Mucilaginibacter pocheonensis]